VDVTPELVRAAQKGDPEAMEELIAGSYRPAYTLALRLLRDPDDAAEATQEAYIRMVRGLKRFREVGAFPTWLFRIVSNVCLTEMRKRSKREVPTEMELIESPSADDTEATAVDRTFRRQLEEAVDGLSDVYRTVVVLRDIYGMSVQETAEALEISPGAVKVRLHRARKRLRDELAPLLEIDGQDGERESA
jgi:RNA polymerase sigma-70 factor, ECF subfamily